MDTKKVRGLYSLLSPFFSGLGLPFSNRREQQPHTDADLWNTSLWGSMHKIADEGAIIRFVFVADFLTAKFEKKKTQTSNNTLC